jgi:hypothetical protein
MASKAQDDFIDQYTRKLMVDWARYYVVHGDIRKGVGDRFWEQEQVFRDHARSKGWISADHHKVLAQGFSTAKAFLRR